MTQPPALRVPAHAIVAIILILVFAFFVRSWLQLELRAQGFEISHARDLSYLMASPALILMLLPIIRDHKVFVLQLLNRSHLTVRVVLSAVALGVLMRIVFWSQLLARISFGLVHSDNPDVVADPTFYFACPPPQVIGLGFLVMAVLVPVVEEILHRGILQSAFVHKEQTIAVFVSAAIFTLFHPPASYAFVFVMGIVLGLQFWNTQTLWTTMITHATYNGLVQLDWRCLRGSWNPSAEKLPVLQPGVWSIAVLIVSLLLITWLLSERKAGAPLAPRP